MNLRPAKRFQVNNPNTLRALILFFATLVSLTSSSQTKMKSNSVFHSIQFTDIDGSERSMAEFKGKYVLVVNVASKCGYTTQYKPLQQLAEQYADKLVVVGFPCNQFMGQEPGSEAEIASFCEKNYGVTFPLSSKIDVKGKEMHPVYRWLTQKEKNGKESNDIGWNFNKFLISPEGEWIGYFGSQTDPLSADITGKIR